MNGEWIVPFRGRNFSGTFNQNFLWRDGSVYVMDNHRAALWCWLQELDLTKKHSLLHIDKHYDALQSRIDEWLENLPPSWDLSIEEYLNQSYENEFGPTRVFRWDNYLSIYLEIFGKAVDRCYLATHLDGDRPIHQGVMEKKIWDLPANTDYWLEDDHGPWIVNVDLDYFFYRTGESADLMVSEKYLKTCFDALAKRMAEGVVSVVTICLTPDEEFTGGWGPSEQLAEQICSYLGVNFHLPNEI